jgi:transcriptional regulator with XRE-family HTH domain
VEETSKIHPELAKKLRTQRERRDRSLRWVSDRVGTSVPYISDVELARRTIAPIRLRQLAQVLEFSQEDLRQLFVLADYLPPEVERRVQKYPQYWDLDPEKVVRALQRAIAILATDVHEAETVKDLQEALAPVPW